MATKRTVQIDIENNANKTTKDINNLNKSLNNSKKAYDAVLKSGDSYEKQLKDIDKIVKTVPLNVRDMNKQIQAYQSIALSAGRETPIGREALEKASQLRDKYVDIQNETKRLADDHRNLNGVMELASIGVAGYGAVQGAMALTGVESEALQKSMQKLMAAQTLLNSVNTIAKSLEKESASMLLLKDLRLKALTVSQTIYTAVTGKSTQATKLFKIALASTGIGLVVVAIGLLIANFDKLLGIFTPVIQKFKDLGDAIGLSDFAGEERFEAEQKRHKQSMANATNEIAKIDAVISKEKERQGQIESVFALELKRAKGNANEIARIEGELNQSRLDSLDETEKQTRDKIKARIKQEESGLAVFQSIVDRQREIGRTDHAKELSEISKRSQVIKKLKKGLASGELAELVNLNVERGNIEVDYQQGVIERQKEANDKYKKGLQDRANAEKRIRDLENQLLEDGINKEIQINEDKFKRLRENTNKNVNLNAAEKKKLVELLTEQEEKAVQKIKDKYDKIDSDREKKRLANIEKQNNDFLDTIEAIQEQNYQNTLSDQERELLAVQDKYFALEEAAQGNADALNAIEIARLNEENDIYNKFQKPLDDKKIADEKAVADAKNTIRDKQIANVEAGISLLKDVAGKNNKLQALAIAAENAVGIAKIIISTQAANAAAKLKYAAIPGGLALAAAEITANKVSAGIGIAASVAAAAKGIASLKASASLDSGGNLGGDGAGGGAAVAPSFNVVGDSGINQIASLQQQPVQAFVVSGEVTTSQALDRNRVENATL